MRYPQPLIALDQALNTLIWSSHDRTSDIWSGFGMADETLSARAYRLSAVSDAWLWARRVIDTVFFWEYDHCRESWVAEINRAGLPRVYRREA
jgi:hypothetical protein